MTPRLLTMVLGCASLLAVTACTHDDDPPQRPIGFRRPVQNRPLVQESADPQAAADTDVPPQSTPSPRRDTTRYPQEAPRNDTPTAPVDYPYGIPVKDKPGFVTSPYAPDSGYVDVHGYATGQEVRDPYTQKVFLVP